MKQGRVQNFDRECENLLLLFQGRSARFCLSFGSAIHSFCPFSVTALPRVGIAASGGFLNNPSKRSGLGFVWCSGKRDARDRSSRLPLPLKPLLNSAPPSLISLSADSWPSPVFFRLLSTRSELFLCCCAGTTCAAAPRLRCTAPQHRRCNFSFLGAGLGIISSADTVDSGVVAASLALLAGTAPSSIFWLSAPRIRR